MKTTRVLVVDDNADHRFFIERALRRIEGANVEVTSARDGEEALDVLFRRNGFEHAPRPHLILLDLRMPRLDGLSVLDAVKHDEELRRIPICVLSSSDRPEDVEQAYENGTNSYVVKSADLDGIRSELAAVGAYWATMNVLPEPPL